MKRLLLALLLATLSTPLLASVTIEITAGELVTAEGDPLPDGSLIQVLASTADDTFAEPTADSFTGDGSDDIVVASFGLASSSAGTAGDFDQVIHLTLSGGLNAGDPLLLRWFPTLTTGATSPGAGTSYGEFRTDATVDGSTSGWIAPADGSTDTFDFLTSSQGGSQPDSAGGATDVTAGGAVPPIPAPQITSATTAQVTAGQAFTYQIAASNTPTAYSATGLPDGLSVNTANGLITGTPTPSGVFNVTLGASNAGGTGTAVLSLTISAPTPAFPVITSATTASVVAGQAFSYQITATNNPATFGASGLPAGLNADAATGIVSGTPTQTGVFNLGLSATNAGGTATASLTLTVSAAAVVPPGISSVLTANAQAAAAFSYQIVASNLPSVYGASGLPAGLSVNTASGLIAGTPTAAGSYQIGLSAANSGGTGTAALALTVTAGPVTFPTITSATTANAILGDAFTYQIAATDNPASFGASGLPAGLAVNATTGVISGTPTATGNFSVGLSATNAGGTGTASLTLTVSAAPVVSAAITSVLAANAQVGAAFSYQITAANDPVSFNAVNLPAGLSLNPASGLISGAPADAGVASITLSASNAGGTGTATLVLTVAAAPLPVVTVLATVPKVTLGTGAVGEITLTLSAALPGDLIVTYAVKGTAVNGTDYQMLRGTKEIKAGKTKVNIKVIPLGDLDGAPMKVVKFILESGDGYAIGTTAPIKVKIYAAP